MTRRPAPRTPASASLTRLLNESLSLLEPRFPARQSLDPADPLPSLLERCEALLVRASAPAPARLAICFGRTAGRAGAALLRQMPGLRLLSDYAFFPTEIRQEDLAGLGRDLLIDAAAAAFDTLDFGSRARGGRLVLLHDAQPGYNHPSVDPEVFLPARLRRRRQLAAVILTDHPLLCWMMLLKEERAGYQPARLEDFSERYLAFLDDYPDLPLVDAAEITADPEGMLGRLASALVLDPGAELIEWLDPTQIAAALSLPKGTMLQDSDGRPATEEPLSSPAYLALCSRLGHDPASLPAHATLRSTPAPAPVTRAPLPRPAPGKQLAHIAALLPRIDTLTTAHSALGAPHRLIGAAEVTGMIEDCLSHPEGYYERLDQLLLGLSSTDGALLLCVSAAHFAAIGQAIHGMDLLSEAVELIPEDDRQLRLLAAELYLRMRRPADAINLLLDDARSGPHRLLGAERALLDATLAPLAPTQTIEHGHALLIERLEVVHPLPLGRRRVLIEIGSTRERVPGQGSTEKLARVCAGLEMDFITVDMDARNTAMARRLFRRLGLPFRAVTAKGEDFLAAWQGPIDYCFLDAYDFDHGNHSELRQSRYEAFLGSRIADAQCHQMHLDCALSLVKKLAPDGVICFDDTWTDEDGAWTAKGTTAMPYLLDHGFKVILARDRAALLVRS